MRKIQAQCRQPGTVFMDSARVDAKNRQSLLFTSPRAQLSTYRSGEVPALIAELDRMVGQGFYAAGFLAYEAGYAFERWNNYTSKQYPLLWFGIYDDVQRFSPREVAEQIESLSTNGAHVGNTAFGLTEPDYTRCIQEIKNCIREGDVYQINFTDAFDFSYEGNAFDLYRKLRSQQGVSYGAYIELEERSILSFSPELFFRVNDGMITTRPMKGTAPRGANLQEDQLMGRWLVNDEKNRAENVMIVDLLRNDLSRICTPGSVHTPALFTLEKYETLYQMTSTVTGRLQKNWTYEAIFRALFPCGSITGAPKLRAMEIIRELETRQRSIYCGSIGYMTPDGQAAFNVAIRSLLLQDGAGRMGTGSGIVWDSHAASEYQECLLKGKFLTQANL